MQKKWEQSPPELVELFYEVVPKDPDIQLRRMFGYPCFFVRGNMCAGLHQHNMILRLSESDRTLFLTTVEGGSIFEPMEGRPMKEYVSLPPHLLDEPHAIKPWLEKSINYVRTLPIKVKKTRHT